MRRLALAFLMVCAASIFAACGDTGDHFLEFRQNPQSTPTSKPTHRPTNGPTIGPETPTPPPYAKTVTKVTLSMPSTPKPASAGTFTLVVKADSGKTVVPAGTLLSSPIQLTSNASCSVTFNNGSSSGTAMTLTTVPSALTITYTPQTAGCTSPSTITILAYSATAKPQTSTFSFPGESAPATPTPPPSSATVNKLTVSMPSTPDPNVAGTFTLVVKASANGKAINSGTSLRSPIQLTSNASCNVSFSNGTSSGTSLTLTSMPNALTLTYTPPTAGCTAPSTITIIAFAATASPQNATVSFPGQGSATPTPPPSAKVSKLKLSMPSTPNPQSPGTFTLVVNASVKGKAIAPGTPLFSPIQLTSNASCNVTFDNGTSTGTELTLTTMPSAVTMTYAPPSSTCTAPPTITITGFVSTASPQTSKVSFAGEAAASAISLSMPATPNPSSNGIYPFYINAKDANGRTIPPGTLLSTPINLGTNATCVTEFSLASGSSPATTISVTSTGQIYLAYNPANSTPTCPGPSTVIVTASAAGARAATFKFKASAASQAVAVSKMTLALPTKVKLSSPGTYPLLITAFAKKGQIPPTTTLTNPISVTSNSSCSVTFNSTATSGATSLSLTTAPGNITINYTPPSANCTPPAQITITALNVNATPKSTSILVVTCATCGSSTVGSIALSVQATPNPTANGIYPLFIALKDSHGNTIPTGQLLANPVQVSSNAACVTAFSTTASNYTSSINLTTAASQLSMSYSPSQAIPTCLAPSQIKVTATATGASSGSLTFTGANPTPTPAALPVARMTLAMPATPNPNTAGTFTLVLTSFAKNASAIVAGTTLKNPIQLTSNSSCSITFGSGATTSLTLANAPGSVEVNYTPPTGPSCTPPTAIVITAFNLDATPQTATLAPLGGNVPQQTVASLSLSMIATPDPHSEGVYPLFVTAKTSSGATIPYGVSLSNPIFLSSNASCATTFANNPSGLFNVLYTMPTTQPIIYVQFNPNPGCTAPVTGKVVITGVAQTGTSGKTSAILFPATNGFPY
jgi:hypothetical protein